MEPSSLLKSALFFLALTLFAIMFVSTVHAGDVHHTYDDLGRLDLTEYSDGYTVYAVDYTYDDAGNILSLARFTHIMDTDGDQIPDGWEEEYGLDPENPNDAGEDILDGDGLTNLEEYQAGTHPTLADTDGDSYSDGDEVAAGTDPIDPTSYPSGVSVPAISWQGGLMICLVVLGLGTFRLSRYPVSVFFMSLILILPLLPSSRVFADCSCSVGSNGIYVIGTEFIATSCSPDPPSDTRNYTYIKYSVRCPNNSYVTNNAFRGDTSSTPDDLSSMYIGMSYRVLRNTAGTHVYTVHPDFRGTIAGVDFNGLAAGEYFADIDGYCCDLPDNTYSCSSSLPDDEDGDSYNECIDCDDNDEMKNPSVDQDGDRVNACDDCDDNDVTKTTGDNCYPDIPKDNGLGDGPRNDGPGSDGGGPPVGSGGGSGDDDDDDGTCGSEDNQNFKGNPINLLNGNKYERHRDVDFPTPHRLGFEFQRYYNSQSSETGVLGYGWTHTCSVSLTPNVVLDGTDHIRIQDMTGQGRYFVNAQGGSTWNGVFKDTTHVVAETDGSYSWHHTNGTVFVFDSLGRLTYVDDAYGNRKSITYDTSDRLDTVTDESTGRVLTFHYNGDNRIESIEGPVTLSVPDGIWVEYGYDARGNLETVDYADGSGIVYEYTDPYDTHNLTARRDKENHLINSWTYDDQDRATASLSRNPSLTVTITYVDETTVTVTDAYGTARDHTLTYYDNHFPRVTEIGGTGCSTCSGHLPVRYEYDNDFNVLEREYADGRLSSYADYDDKGNPGTVTRAVGTTDEKTVAYTYHPVLGTLLSRTETSVLGAGDKVTIWDYDDDGDTEPNENPTLFLSRKIKSGYTKNQAGEVVPFEYITTFTYNTRGQLTSVDGILPGTDDTTTYAYDPTTGDLLSITRPIVGATSFGDYDDAGNPGHMIDVNSRQTDYTYDGRNRLLTTTRSGLTRSRIYRPSGDVSTVTDTGGRTLTYTYDPAHGRLTRITDDLGNYLFYDYDSQGSRSEDSAYDSSDTRTRYKRYDYDHPEFPGKLWKIINPDDSEIVYGYDAMGRMASVRDERLRTTTYQYDPLSRLESVIQPGTVTTGFDYDTQGNRTTVTDPNTNATTFTYDDDGRVLSETSPDRGTTTYVYDVANNRVFTTDANTITVIQTFDALGRPVSVTYPSDSSISLFYDTGTDAMGRLSTATDQSGQTAFAYNTLGRIASETRSHTGLPDAVTSYGYSPSTGDLTTLTYPGGMVLSYGYDNVGRISSILADGQNVVSTVTYRPFGPVEDYTLGDSLLTVDQSFNLRYHIDRIQAGDMDYDYHYYADGTVEKIGGIPFPTTLFTDATSFTCETGSNRLDFSTGSRAGDYTTDDHGNIISDGTNTYIYNESNRLIEVRQGETTLAEYAYDYQNRRIRKITAAGTVYYHYDLMGHLISETDETGTTLRDYIYLGSKPIAMRLYGAQAGIYYILTDHLGTPQRIIDESGTVVWQAYYMPYGDATLIAETITCHLRFPGQYFDSETGLHYNWNRYYDPGTGRYLTPDPIGLDGGINLYAYVDGNAVNFIDPNGLLSAGGPSSVLNSIECDGKGGIRPKVNSANECVRDCKMRHEMIHVEHALRLNPIVCQGKPPGTAIGWTDNERYITEMVAISVEQSCLLSKLARMDKCDPCYVKIEVELDKNEVYREHIENNY